MCRAYPDRTSSALTHTCRHFCMTSGATEDVCRKQGGFAPLGWAVEHPDGKVEWRGLILDGRRPFVMGATQRTIRPLCNREAQDGNCKACSRACSPSGQSPFPLPAVAKVSGQPARLCCYVSGHFHNTCERWRILNRARGRRLIPAAKMLRARSRSLPA